MFYTYIIYSASCDIYYKGISEDPDRRLLEHNQDKSRYTSGKGPWSLVYIKAFETRKQALIEERRIKSLNRRSLEHLLKESGG
ncbi:MAG: GIY-YIG nuclease family protein [Bacteroidales bacterium]|nr:GIY-YIG nuclease family protein [Bacteroidales bacterium]